MISTVFSGRVQYRDAFLKENPTYKWYNPARQSQPTAANKSVAVLPSSTTYTNSAAAADVSPIEQISTGKLAGNIIHQFVATLLACSQWSL